jgi:hypothetical protein
VPRVVLHLADGRLFTARLLKGAVDDEYLLHVEGVLDEGELPGCLLKSAEGLPPRPCRLLDVRSEAGITILRVSIDGE